jgi:hypothetical protein
MDEHKMRGSRTNAHHAMIEDRSSISHEKPENSREARGAHLKSVTRRALDLCGVHEVLAILLHAGSVM